MVPIRAQSPLRVATLRLDREDNSRKAFDLLQACPDSFAQQTPQWGAVIEALGVDEAAWLGCWRGTRLVALLPAYRFRGPLGAILTSVPQAGPLGGIACSSEESRDEVYPLLLEAFVSLANDLECELASLITNPFVPDRSLYERYFQPDFLLENTLHALSLSEVVDQHGELVEASSSLRRNLRKAHAAGLWIDEEQSRANVDEWIEIHRCRHNAIGATPLPAGLFRAALEHMVPADLARFFFVRTKDTNELAAGGLYLHHARTMDAFMPSMDTRFAERRPNHMLALHTIQYAKRRGFNHYNWQGSPPDSGVARFKQQWGGNEHGYCFATRITGRAEAFLSASIEELTEGYPWHYVLPFDRLGKEAEQRSPSRRADAWAAREASERTS